MQPEYKTPLNSIYYKELSLHHYFSNLFKVSIIIRFYIRIKCSINLDGPYHLVLKTTSLNSCQHCIQFLGYCFHSCFIFNPALIQIIRQHINSGNIVNKITIQIQDFTEKLMHCHVCLPFTLVSHTTNGVDNHCCSCAENFIGIHQLLYWNNTLLHLII